MKKIFLLFVCASSFAVAHSQVKFGVKGGLNLANLTGNDIQNASIKAGFNAGVLAEFGITKSISLKPELIYSGQGAKSSGDGMDAKLNLNYLNIPVLVKYTSASGFFAETGPQIGILTSAKSKYGSTDVDIKDSFKKTDFSWAFGLGYQLPQNIGFNARYNLGLSNIPDGDGKARNGVIQIGVFYLFGNSK